MINKLIFITLCAVGLIQGNLYGALSNDPNFIKAITKQIVKHKDGGIFNLSFKSTIDGSIQPLMMKIPKDYDHKIKWPLLVVLHGKGDGPIIVPLIDSMVQIGPFGRGDLFYRGLGEKDVLETLEMATKIFNIDHDRIYLTGFSMGAMGTFDLGLKYPHLWAACVPVCGKLQNPLLIDNALSLPFWIHAGKQDMVIPSSNSKQVFELAQKNNFTHWQYTEYKEMGHSFSVNWPDIAKWLLKQSRANKPERIIYSGKEPGKIYWFHVDDLIDSNKPYRFDAAVKGQQIHLKTVNIASYKIHQNQPPTPLSMKPVIIENGIVITDEDSKKSLFR